MIAIFKKDLDALVAQEPNLWRFKRIEKERPRWPKQLPPGLLWRIWRTSSCDSDNASNFLPCSCGTARLGFADDGNDDDDSNNDNNSECDDSCSVSNIARSRAENFNHDQLHYMEARERCDNSSIESVNLWYPPCNNKGTFNCPLSLINKANTRKVKSLVVRYWCKLSAKQHGNKWDDMLLTQQQKKQFLLPKLWQSLDVNATDNNHVKTAGLWLWIITEMNLSMKKHGKEWWYWMIAQLNGGIKRMKGPGRRLSREISSSSQH